MQAAALALCQDVCPMPHGHYEVRLVPGLYDALLLHEGAEGQLHSVQMINDFEDGGRRYIYLGPLVSRYHGYAPMLVGFLRTLYTEIAGYPLAVMTEAQNPLIALMMLHVFDGFAAPSMSCHTGLDPKARDALVATFAARLPHVGDIDWETLSTRSSTTMYRPHRRYTELVAWFRGRGVDFAAGASQIVVAALSTDAAERVLQARRALERAAPLLSSAPAVDISQNILTWFNERRKYL